MASSYRIGVDGGGTKTECILVDPEGAIVARHVGPGCNPSLIGPDQAGETLVNALLALLSTATRSLGLPEHGDPRVAVDAISISHTLLCMAGSPTFWRETAAQLHGYGRVSTATDARPVLELATEGGPGLVLHAGTGSFIAARAPDGSEHFFAGFGWRLGDPGSAHDIGRRGLQRALAELQGCAPATALAAALTESFGTAVPGEITAALYQDPEANRRIAAFSSQVCAQASAGNTAALDIVLSSANELLGYAESAARRLFPNAPLGTISAGLSGSILSQSYVFEALRARTDLPLKLLRDAPIEGVRRLLSRLA